MRFTLTIDCDNAAFADPDTGAVDVYSVGPELVRILTDVADAVASGEFLDRPQHTRSVLDVNGTRVGSAKLAEVDA